MFKTFISPKCLTLTLCFALTAALAGCSDDDDNRAPQETSSYKDLKIGDKCEVTNFIPYCVGTKLIECYSFVSKPEVSEQDCAFSNSNGSCGEINGAARCYTPCSKEGEKIIKCGNNVWYDRYTCTRSGDILYYNQEPQGNCDSGMICSDDQQKCIPEQS
ncbi:MAG: hypothetical protein J6A01_02715 [Proteobacteria bacterium]|nr:hypothetical protein [Pseudomonadota bacterium]